MIGEMHVLEILTTITAATATAMTISDSVAASAGCCYWLLSSTGY